MLKRVLALALIFLLGLAATLWYLARQDRAAGSSLSPGSWNRVEAPNLTPGESSQIRLREEDVGRLVVNGLRDHPDGERLLDAAKDVRVSLDDGRVEIGVLVNLEDLRHADLSADERETVEKILRYLPFLEDKDLYLAVNGAPAVEDGKVTVEEDLKVKLAFLSLPVGEFGETLGFDPAELRERLAIDLSPLVATAVAVADGELVISVGT